MFTKKTIKDIGLGGQTVLLRADYNVPLENGVIMSDYRLEQSLPTIQALLDGGVEKLIICSHLGRPKGPEDTQLSLLPVARRLSQLLGREVKFAADCVGEAAETAVASLGQGEILLLENLRFHSEEEANDDGFAKRLAGLAGPEGIFVQDGFGVVHRAHASTVAITRHLKSVAGLLLEKEVDTITEAMQNPRRPLMAIVGGAKIADKIDVLNRFIEIADLVAVGGGMANTFLAAQGVDVAASLYDKDNLDVARETLVKAEAEAARRPFMFTIPQDGIVAEATDGTSPARVVGFAARNIGDIDGYPKAPPTEVSQLGPDDKIMDIGPSSAAFIADTIKKVNTVIWNGPMGKDEVPAFAAGTTTIIEALPRNSDGRPSTIVGGGDTATLLEKLNLLKDFYVSTGGGASLDLIAGHPLPGVDALSDKK